MAIVVEEQKTNGGGSSLVSVVIWLVILGIIGAAIYYVFFTQPQLVEVVAPAGYKSTEQLAKLDLNPNEVLTDTRFIDLRSYVTLAPSGLFGKQNPFLVEEAPPVVAPKR